MKLHRLADEFVGADDNVYLAFLQIFQYCLGLFGGTGTRQIIHTDWQILQTALEGLEMLVSQYGGRHEYSHLLGVAGCLECSTHRHLGLTESHVATY